MELRCLTLHKDSNRKKKGIALKAISSKLKDMQEKKEEGRSDSTKIDEDNMALFVRKFYKFLKK
ncbi:hypothetical protein Lal_00027017 [Lupinus albus]|nr:hypothetical protein Lal_00027017 [Lupinus albus]